MLRKISLTVVFQILCAQGGFFVGTKKGNLGVVALGIEWVACFYSSIVLPVRADSSAAKTIFRLLIASVMCWDRSTFSVIALCR